ncbi:nitronate monooxygenase [Demetria terragena]|uniref:nitronate monooxygenase n=1 Tax=Demetria terragena TaxID=63959 RepID=UPI00036429CF|nr:nitronate monooxygenase [Demetria terragena]
MTAIKPSLAVNTAGLDLALPIMAAAGCGGFGQDLARLGVLSHLGALVTPSISARSHATAHRVRLQEAPSSLVLPTDWPSVGTNSLKADALPWDVEGAVPVVASLVGTTSNEFGSAAAGLRRQTALRHIMGVEVNLGCPDATNRGIPFSHADFAATKVVSRVREELPRDIPVIAKLSADVSDLVAIARGCVKSGAAGIVVTGPLRALAMSGTRLSLPAESTGLAGPALLPVTLRAVYDLTRAIREGRLPSVAVIAVGGISTGQQVAQAMAVGASAVQVGTALIHDPGSLATLAQDLSAVLTAHDLTDVRDLVGLAHT